ncbi:MAG: dihydroorotase [Bacteroidetes bacterium]|nr:MAG: dihydroorotase [Bacteroidota bacterium]
MKDLLIRNARVVNEGKIIESDLLIVGGRIERLGQGLETSSNVEEFDAGGKYLIPGCIDDQVHFREPGLTHKATIASESKAAVAGGITTFMEMPNTVPNTLTIDLLEDKYRIAEKCSPANYSFYMGASNENLEEVLKVDHEWVCGVKVFMGSSTGNMLVDNEQILDGLFSQVEGLIATHCEDEATIRKNTEEIRAAYGEEPPISIHPIIRNAEACYRSSSMAVRLAEKYGTRLHILHISTARELELFRNDLPLKEKRITAEACVHHLWFTDADYDSKGSLIKWNPAVKSLEDREEIWKALLDDRIDVIATDHAPHTLEEKNNSYFKAPSGGPLVQHALPAMLDQVNEGRFDLPTMVRKMAHAPADCFRLKDRGYVREGYWADLVLVDLDAQTKVEKKDLLYACAWSPFEGVTFRGKVLSTWVNGEQVYDGEKVLDRNAGKRIQMIR